METLKRLYVDQEASNLATLIFRVNEECQGEVLLADLYEIGETESVARVSTGAETAPSKGKLATMTLDFTGVASGAYSMKLWTDETGVLARNITIIK